jgi:Carboxypeptidase regulatory-like domain
MLRFLLSLALPSATWACSCLASGPPCDAAWKASAVFVGTVVELTRDVMPNGKGAAPVNGFLRTHVVFEVAEAYVGMEGRGKRVEIRTGTGGGDCGYPFQRTQSYVVYAHENEDGQLVASICSRTAAVDRAQADLAYLRSVSSSAQFGYLYGVASNGEKAVRFGQTFGPWLPPGIPGVTVTLSGLGQSRHLVTGEDGSFRFDDLSPGKYNVAVAKEGYSLRGDSAAFDVPAGGCAYAWETLVVDRRIVGKVAVADECDFSNHRPKGPLRNLRVRCNGISRPCRDYGRPVL